MNHADRLVSARATVVSDRPSTVPVDVHRAFLLWLTAVAAGVAEVLVRVVASLDAPTAGQLVVRAGIYVLVVGLIAGLRTGRNLFRIILAVLLGIVGTFSLVFEPAWWLLAGNSVVAFLGGADGATLLIVLTRIAHLVAVVGAMVLMFRPNANAFFRRNKTQRSR